jgi:membrane protein YdbS with pleckstrin-like domain
MLGCVEASAERDLSPLHPRVRILWWCSAAITAVPLSVAVVFVDAVLAPTPMGVVSGPLILLIAVAVAVVPPLRYRRWRYALRSDELEIRRGIVWTRVSVIPYARLQFVDTRRGPLDQWLGLATLVVHTAAVGTSGVLPGLGVDTAEQLRSLLSRDVAGDHATV